MASTQLTHMTAMTVGATAIARPVSANFEDRESVAESASDAVPGNYSEDRTGIRSSARLSAQDPLALTTILALSFPGAIVGEGQVVNAATYQKHTLANGILIGFGLTVRENGPGQLTLELVNRAADGTAALSTEHTVAAGSGPSLTSRAGTIKFASSGHSFTPAGGSVITFGGIEQLTIQGRAFVDEGYDMGSQLMDQVTVTGWKLTGTLTLRDRTITAGLVTPQTLATQIRGTLVTQLQLTGKTSDQTPPTDQVLTCNYLQFQDPASNLQTRQRTGGTVAFGQILRDGATVKALTDMYTIADLV